MIGRLPLGDRARRVTERGNSAAELGRNRWTRSVDALIKAARTYAPPVHWIGSFLLALVLFVYVRFLAWTTHVKLTSGAVWPSTPSVLAVWHGAAPSLLVAVTATRAPPIAILVACDPRGDALAWLCRLLGFQVVRGDRTHRQRGALARLADELGRGASVIITADGEGPARVAKIGAVALAAKAGVPVIAIGAECRPSLSERHKWDVARNPLPFGRIGIVIGDSIRPTSGDLAGLRGYRRWLQKSLDEAAAAAHRGLESI